MRTLKDFDGHRPPLQPWRKEDVTERTPQRGVPTKLSRREPLVENRLFFRRKLVVFELDRAPDQLLPLRKG